MGKIKLGDQDCVLILREDGDHEIHMPEHQTDNIPANVELMILLALAMQDQDILDKLEKKFIDLVASGQFAGVAVEGDSKKDLPN